VSIPVTDNDVPARLEEYGSAAFLVTVGVDGSAKVVHVSVVWDASAGAFRCTPGGGTLRNLTKPGPVTLVFPPPENGDHSMLVDGIGRVVGDAEVAEVEFVGGVLHRPAPSAPGDQVDC
tara:strand:- start:3260 stop:3616 length:357 start_codon:yes stop_codon:yes gene_type:complete